MRNCRINTIWLILPLLLIIFAPSTVGADTAVKWYSAESVPISTGHAPEPAAVTLSGVGLASLGGGWYFSKIRLQRRFRDKLAAQATGNLTLVEPASSQFWADFQIATYLATKRLLDVSIASIMLLLLSPIFAIIALAIFINSPGPVLYAQRRLGEGRRQFRLYKFRSMCMNADQVLKKVLEEDEEKRKEFELLFKLKNDPRVTKVGAFLRKTSLDELPQLINVLRGDISLVGPRPIVEAEVDKYWPFEERLFSVKPGVTGLWQVSGRNDTTYEERVRLDMRYIAERSLAMDISILFNTIPALLKRDGAY